MKRGLALFLAALLAALTLTACGGGGSSAPAASESQTDSGASWKAEVRDVGVDTAPPAAAG